MMPALRGGLDLTPARGALHVRDPRRYAEHALEIPRRLVPALAVLDGTWSTDDARRALARRGIDDAMLAHLVERLDEEGYLLTPRFETRRARVHARFAASDVRLPAFAGAAYPSAPDALRGELDSYLARATSPAPRDDALIGIAAPHASPFGASRCYGEAYAAVGPHLADRTFVLLGTSHHGAPNRLGLTRKAFRTPLGDVPTDVARVDALLTNGGAAMIDEDYAHAIEHALEFQVLFLQHRMRGAPFRIVPILVGPWLDPADARPDTDPSLAPAFAALRALADDPEVFWVLGVDLAHVGPRYGGDMPYALGSAEAEALAADDAARLATVVRGDAAALWTSATPRTDALSWCGTSSLYALLASTTLTAEQRAYEQWAIEAGSIVSATALHLWRRRG
jgi:AmmeMemoRadiSam system protein B